MKKLWKVKVNHLGWFAPRTMYYESKLEAIEAYAMAQAADPVEYAGNFTDAKADELLARYKPGYRIYWGY